MSQSDKPSKKPLTKEQKIANRKEKARDRAFLNAHRSIFARAGFTRLTSVDGVHFTYAGIKSELDDIFVFENVVILAEYTRSKAANLGTHAKGKAGIHNKIGENQAAFLKFFSQLSPSVAEWLKKSPYTEKQLQFAQIYASVDALEDHHAALFSTVKFMSESERGYFSALTKSIKLSSRFELLQFLGISPAKVGSSGVIGTGKVLDDYECIILPEEQSHFPEGFRVVSFYVDPEALLKRAYVLRRNGWRDGLGLYQRLIIPAKISAIRNHLRDKRRVFANNIVITLPSGTRLTDSQGVPVNHSDISKPTLARVELPREANSIGIIDGQHRVFSYYEDLEPDPDIDAFRTQQNLLATGLIYPHTMALAAREKFEAGLFLEINSTQASASSDIIQAIWVLLDPFRPVAVARMVINRLSEMSPLKGRLARTSLDAGKIKTASIVAYGLQPLLKRSGTDSIFYVWDNVAAKSRFVNGKATDADLTAYIEFCVELISKFLNEVRIVVGDNKWRIADGEGDGILSVTSINGLVILLRKLIEAGKVKAGHQLPSLSKIGSIDFNIYRSSQYAELASNLYKLV